MDGDGAWISFSHEFVLLGDDSYLLELKILMKFVTRLLAAMAFLIAVSSSTGFAADQKPNFVIIFADDLGYGLSLIHI